MNVPIPPSGKCYIQFEDPTRFSRAERIRHLMFDVKWFVRSNSWVSRLIRWRAE